MPWANLDDGTWTDPVLGALSDRAFRLHVNTYAYCADLLTDGRVDARQVAQIAFMFQLASANEIKAAVDELLQAGVWTEDLNGFIVPSYVAANRSRAEVEADRASTRARVRKFRKGRKRAR
jgi:hypothetical protein